MGRPLQKIEALAGVKDLASLLEVLSDPKRYAACLKEMEGLRDQINVRIEAVGHVDQIQRLRAEATSMHAEARKALSAALDRIEADRAEWEAVQTSAREAFEADQTAAAEAFEARDAELTEQETSARQRADVLEDRDRASTRALQEAHRDRTAAAELRAEYEARVQRLNDAIG